MVGLKRYESIRMYIVNRYVWNFLVVEISLIRQEFSLGFARQIHLGSHQMGDEYHHPPSSLLEDEPSWPSKR